MLKLLLSTAAHIPMFEIKCKSHLDHGANNSLGCGFEPCTGHSPKSWTQFQLRIFRDSAMLVCCVENEMSYLVCEKESDQARLKHRSQYGVFGVREH